MKTYSYNEMIQMYGRELIDAMLEENIEPTSRVMYAAFENPAHLGKNEWASEPVQTEDGTTIQAFFYLSDSEDTDMYDWAENAEFVIE